jgi:hypothetical protein
MLMRHYPTLVPSSAITAIPAIYRGTHQIVEDDEDSVAVRFYVRTQKTPIHLEKELRLRSGKRHLLMEETLANESKTPLHVKWGHHLAFGRPFLASGGGV